MIEIIRIVDEPRTSRIHYGVVQNTGRSPTAGDGLKNHFLFFFFLLTLMTCPLKKSAIKRT